VTASAWLRTAPDVDAAIRTGGPIVALETAVISHGMAAAVALAVADRMAAAVRSGGGLPAFVGVREGRVEVGLARSALAALLEPGTIKVAERDLAVAVGLGLSGGTTVSATLAVAAAAGIRVMATGGIGGVHYGAERTGDVSADLAALSRFPVVVVCAGPKAICDPGRTVEALDSLGVAVIGYRTDMLPGFLAASSGVPVPYRAGSAGEIAAVAAAQRRIGTPGALLVVQPPPAAAAMDERELHAAVRGALARADAAGLRAAELTPFLLRAIADATGGRSVAANVAVLDANARLAGEIARALVALAQRA
jgi:pseudouridine-5'-phosphate glycosidase